jgi:hypothetical protein
VHAERVSDVSSTDYPGVYPGQDDSWNLKKFKKVRQANFSDKRGHSDKYFKAEPSGEGPETFAALDRL